MSTINITLKVWRQKNNKEKGKFETYKASNISVHMSFLEMLDVVNENIEAMGIEPITFEHDCREGICGSCGFMINGQPHGHRSRTTTCQLHMREFSDGDVIVLEPFRAKAFPIIKDLMVDRSSFDRIIQSGGFISIRTGAAPEANVIPIKKHKAEMSFEAAACIGCGACVASCPNAAAMLFTGAKITHLGMLPQGQTERYSRAQNMVHTMDSEDFGHCSNYGACSVACPKEVPLEVISQMNWDYLVSKIKK